MIVAADVVRYLLSAGGVILAFLLASVWVFLSCRPRRPRRVLLALALAFTLCSIYGLQIAVARVLVGSLEPFQQRHAVPGRRTAVVILGSGSVEVEDWDGRTFSAADRSALSRVLEASRVFRLIEPAIVISSGGDPHPERGRPPTGETMRDTLVMLGVPADRIMVETRSRTTREEALVVAPMLQAQGVEQVVLVTSETHMRRSLGVFRAAGVTAIPAIAQEYPRSETSWVDLLFPSDEGLWFASANAHEVIGIAYYWLRGWVK
jgi:uncharacterized SAM-binding protein YcdF (DUF218 family)